jgi:hypothetical protein
MIVVGVVVLNCTSSTEVMVCWFASEFVSHFGVLIRQHTQHRCGRNGIRLARAGELGDQILRNGAGNQHPDRAGERQRNEQLPRIWATAN